MDYEKMYKKALKRVRRLHDRMLVLSSTDALVAGSELEFIFPELAESEDERIRKELKEAFEAYDIESKWNGIPIRSIFAWLEKQKESIEKEYVFRPLAGTDITIAAEQAIRRANEGDHLVLAFNGVYLPVRKYNSAKELVDEYDACLEKQKENSEIPINASVCSEKPNDHSEWNDFEIRLMDCMLAAQQYRQGSIDLDIVKPWAEELSELIEQSKQKWNGFDEDCLKRAIWYVENPAPSVVKDTNLVLWLKFLPEKFVLEPKQEWSEEDKAFLKVAIAICNRYSHKDIADWLKSLPERFSLQQKVEWSEEDEKNCNRIVRFLEPHKTFFPTKETKEEMQNWLNNRLKSLRPQYHGDVTMTEAYKMGLEAGKASSWKPSEEQMEALEAATVRYQSTGLESLYEELKKL